MIYKRNTIIICLHVLVVLAGFVDISSVLQTPLQPLLLSHLFPFKLISSILELLFILIKILFQILKLDVLFHGYIRKLLFLISKNAHAAQTKANCKEEHE